MYDKIYSQDNEKGDAHGWIQWKGTDVCIDLHCKCGYHGHFDGDFFYNYGCPSCHKKYMVGSVVKLIELKTDEELEFGNGWNGFITCEMDDSDA